jgi:hypothetical protein
MKEYSEKVFEPLDEEKRKAVFAARNTLRRLGEKSNESSYKHYPYI